MAQGSWTSLQLYCRFTASLAYTYDNYTPYEYQTLLRAASVHARPYQVGVSMTSLTIFRHAMAASGQCGPGNGPEIIFRAVLWCHFSNNMQTRDLTFLSGTPPDFVNLLQYIRIYGSRTAVFLGKFGGKSAT
ncbi:hypothetical protein TcasGA2_TC007224 [Tribolium castaneum]|uniref:Uncharacterized protein n=1 Tax=Tribolium castaneum TaxID=7070 RepID=D2A0Q2_TRICA|nr:hypothetical protein TcasGA2_TC007224 [Tribolium castaneum]